jgi:hypothetical protein
MILKNTKKNKNNLLPFIPLPKPLPQVGGAYTIVNMDYSPLLSCLAPPKRLREGEGRRGLGDEAD